MLPRLYAILDVAAAEARGLQADALFDVWIDAGVRLIQLRAKSMASGAMLALAERLARRARETDAIFVVNDRADIARLSGARGVHLGQDDLTPTDVRRLFPVPALLGLSTHTADQMTAAVEEPLDYVAIGPVFSTSSKARPDPVIGLTGVREAAAIARTRGLPLVAIGGITLSHVADVIEAGADAVAVIAGLMDGDPATQARAFLTRVGP